MSSMRRRQIPTDSLLQLRQRLSHFPQRSPERRHQIAAVATLYGLSPTTVYRALRDFNKPFPVHRRDHGRPRVLQFSALEHYCELISALKLRTTNKKGRHISTPPGDRVVGGVWCRNPARAAPGPKRSYILILIL